MRILVYHPTRTADYVRFLQEHGLGGELAPCCSMEEIEAALPDAEVLFCWRFPTALLTRAPRLRWIQAMGAGVEDMAGAPIPPGVVLTRVEGGFGGYMSEYVLGYLLHHTLQVGRVLRQQQERRWDSFIVGRLAGKRIGIAGVGTIGREVARACRQMGMEVWGLSRSGVSEAVDRAFPPEQIQPFAAGVDFLVDVLPVTPATERIFNAAVFRAMKPGALFLNMGRSRTVDEGALVDAVSSGHLAGAVLDVFDPEPLPPESPLWSTPGILVTPHVSGPSVPAEVAEYFAANYRRWQAGDPLRGVVDLGRGY